jgi:DNA-binding CsgD family transcriptional regulator
VAVQPRPGTLRVGVARVRQHNGKKFNHTMGVLVVGPASVSTEALVRVLAAAGHSARCVPPSSVATAAAANSTSSLVFVPAPGMDPNGVIDVVRDRPDLQLVVIAPQGSEPPCSGRNRPVVVNSVEGLLTAVSDHKARNAGHGLTNRHVRILQELADGSSPSEAAVQLGITVKTLNNHLGTVYKRLGARNVTQAVLIALRSGAIRLT